MIQISEDASIFVRFTHLATMFLTENVIYD